MRVNLEPPRCADFSKLDSFLVSFESFISAVVVSSEVEKIQILKQAVSSLPEMVSLIDNLSLAGQNQQEVAYQLASLDAMLNLDTTDLKAIEAFTQQRAEHYEKEFTKIGNVTVLDPDPKCRHAFENSCYQSALQTIVKKYQHR